jgi:pimeloyl-ACP methyl ester carboxylesterase
MRHPILVVALLLILTGISVAKSPPSPVIFVHGIGDSSVAWRNTGPAVSSFYEKYYKTKLHPYFESGSGIGEDRFDKDFSDNPRNSCVYVTFLDHFASPEALVPELDKLIYDTREEVWANFRADFRSKDEIKVNLVTHSMGGLVVRSYLTANPDDHHVDKFIMISSPNLGSTGLIFNWVPAGMMFGGIGLSIATANPLPLVLTVIGLGTDMFTQARGVKLLSPAVDSMKPDSAYLKKLNDEPMPEDVEYICILSNTEQFLHGLSNRILWYEGGDGAVSIDSQKLSEKSVPNFAELNYKEYLIDAPHYEEPDKAEGKIIEALGLSTSQTHN